MRERVVEVGHDGRHICKDRGFLVVKSGEEEVGKIPLDDIGSVIANAHGITYSNSLVAALAERSIPLVVCDAKFAPVAMMWPTITHHRQCERFDAQVNAGAPLKKRLWQDIIRCKIKMQSEALQAIDKFEDARKIGVMVQKVLSGDSTNVESQAARQYFPAMFGPEFRRDRGRDGLNAFLNYGYTILRSTMARAIMGAGLHPSFAIHHENVCNPMRLVDDLLEPFRPVADLHAHFLSLKGEKELHPETKRFLVKSSVADMQGNRGIGPVSEQMQRLATSFAQVLLKERQRLALPKGILPIVPVSGHE